MQNFRHVVLYEDKKISLDFHICINAPLMEHYIRKCNINVCNNVSSKDLKIIPISGSRIKHTKS